MAGFGQNVRRWRNTTVFKLHGSNIKRYSTPEMEISRSLYAHMYELSFFTSLQLNFLLKF